MDPIIIALITGILGLPFSIIGAMAGGWLISRYSLRKMIWPFLLAQNLTNLTYMMLASYLLNSFSPETAIVQTPDLTNIILISLVTAFDHLAGGLGTAVLMTFLMGLCRGNFAGFSAAAPN